MKNTLKDLNNHLFAQLERLNDESISPEELEKEMDRAKSVVSVANAIVANANVQMRAFEYMKEQGYTVQSPELLGIKAAETVKRLEAYNEEESE